MSGEDPRHPGNEGYQWLPHSGDNELDLGGYGAPIPLESSHYNNVNGGDFVGAPAQSDPNPYGPGPDAVVPLVEQHLSQSPPFADSGEGDNRDLRRQDTVVFVQGRQDSFERREACRDDGDRHQTFRIDNARGACDQYEERSKKKKGGHGVGSSCKPADKSHRPHDHGGGSSGGVVLSKGSSSKDRGDKESKSKGSGGQGARAKESRDKQLRKESKNKDSKSEGSKSMESKTKGSSGRSR